MVASKLFSAIEDCVLDAFEYEGKTLRKHRDLADKRDAREAAKLEKLRETSVKFDADGNITSATPERLAALENYRKQVEANGENEIDIEYAVNDTRLTRNMIAFATAMEIDFNDEN